MPKIIEHADQLTRLKGVTGTPVADSAMVRNAANDGWEYPEVVRKDSASLGFYPAARYGFAADGATDDSTALSDALTELNDEGGGTLMLPPGTYRINSQTIFPNDGAATPNNVPIRIIGAGAHVSGQGQAANGGTILDLRYAGVMVADGVTTNTSTTVTSATANFTANDEGMEIRGTGIPANTYIVTRNSTTSVTISQAATATATGVTLTVCRPKIITLGLGHLDISGVTFYDGGTTGGSPFLQTTNTTLRLHRNAFIGRSAASTLVTTITSAAQDAIILGGTRDEATLDGSHNSAFQGYGTVIRENYFNRVRRLVFGRVFANGNVVRDNTSWTGCGADSTAAAIEFSGGVADTDSGNVVVGNLIEMNHYAYGVKLANAVENTIGPNNFFDEGAGVLAHTRIESTAVYNRIVAGFHSDSFTFVSEATARQNDIVNSHQSQTSRVLQKQEFSGGAGFVTYKNPSLTTVSGPALENSAGDRWYDYGTYNSGTGFGSFIKRFTPNGGSDEDLFNFQRAASGQSRFRLLGTVDDRVEADGPLRIYAAAANTVFIGDALSSFTVTNGIIAATKGFSAGSQALTYGANVSLDPASGAYMRLNVTNTTALAIGPPSTATAGQELTLEIKNSSGGAMGAITWSSAAGGYSLAGAFTNPANGAIRTISFRYNSTSQRWVEVSRAAADIT